MRIGKLKTCRHEMATVPTTNMPSMPMSRRGEPTWEMALFYPRQGEWTEEDYLALDGRTNRLIELSDGCLEVLPMPTPFHQRVMLFLYGVLNVWVIARGLGEVLVAPMPVRLWDGKLREPDVVFLRPKRVPDPHAPPNGADLAMEIVSEGEENRKRDIEIKPEEYARAGIAEYWIVDPHERRITVLTLDGQTYREHGVFGPGSEATSVLLSGFSVNVDAVFAAGEG
jgi:Uma2 family endonuclease